MLQRHKEQIRNTINNADLPARRGEKEKTMYYARWFKNEEDAKKFQKEHGGVLYKNVPKSRTKRDHLDTATMMGFDPEEFRYSVNWKRW